MEKSEKVKYYITYGPVDVPECKYGFSEDSEQQRKKSCFKSEKCPENVVCQKGFRGIRNPHFPPDICPTPRCYGDRPTTCITEFCPEFSQAGRWRCPLGELPHEAKEVFEEKLATLGSMHGEYFTLLSENALGLSDPKAGIRHSALVEKFRELRREYLNADYEIADSHYIQCMMDCQRLATSIRKEDARYTRTAGNESNTGILLSLEDAASTEQLELGKRQTSNEERNRRIYELACDKKLQWREIAETISEEFNESPLEPGSVARAAKRYWEKHGLPPYPQRTVGCKPKSQR